MCSCVACVPATTEWTLHICSNGAAGLKERIWSMVFFVGVTAADDVDGQSMMKMMTTTRVVVMPKPMTQTTGKK